MKIKDIINEKSKKILIKAYRDAQRRYKIALNKRKIYSYYNKNKHCIN